MLWTKERRLRGVLSLLMWVFVALGPAVHAVAAEESATDEPQAEQPTTITTGSGERYKTTVERRTEGELAAEDFRQASLLGSRLLVHLNRAITNLNDDQPDAARDDLERAQSLSRIIRELLPTTIVTTVVEDSAGKEVYRYTDRVQSDRIPVFEGMVAVKVIEPIAEAKEDAATVKGVRLAEAQQLRTSVLLDLSYVDRKISRAIALLKEEQDEALDELLLAQARGVSFEVNKQDDPLVDAQAALQIAERMVEQERYEAAKANLQLAKNYLEVYRSLISKDDAEKVRDLEKEIMELHNDMQQGQAAEKIRGFWDRVTGWFMRAPGEAHKSDEQ